MFNEAFWFFYLVDVVGAIRVPLGVGGYILVGYSAFVAYAGAIEGYFKRPLFKKSVFRAIIIGGAMILTASFLPTERALLAGGAQYAVEATNADETLLRLKELLDKKLADD